MSIYDIGSLVETIVKKDGREEPFNLAKFDKYIGFVTLGDEVLKDSLLRDTVVKLKPKTKVRVLADSIVDTAVSKISPLQTKWEYVAARAYLLNLYSDTYNIKDGKKYPHLAEVIKKGISLGIYSKSIADTYSEYELEELNAYIRQEEDFTFTYDALKQFVQKYCKGSRNKKLELPQITYMRVAMGIFYNDKDRMQLIKELYDILTKGEATLATPIMMNSFTPLNQYASCILNTMGNSTDDIANKVKTALLYTKGRGGLAFDVSPIQSKGTITNNGTQASGIVPYIQDIQAAVTSMAQGSDRRGQAVITLAWWHLEVEAFLELKDASGGTPETRALGLKYALATDKYFKEAVIRNQDVVLVCPKAAPNLLQLSGDSFTEAYLDAITSLPASAKKVVSARELFKKFIKYRFQTGNIYETMLDNINNAGMTNRHVGSSNLCQEIIQPSREGTNYKEYFTTKNNGKKKYVATWEDEEIALCNLASYNVCITKYPREKLDRIVYVVHRAIDTTIDIGTYMRTSGHSTNLDYRYVGLGMNNVAYFVADSKVLMDSKEAEELMYTMTQTLTLSILRSSAKLAKELGTFPKYRETKWAEGILPIDLANKELKEEFKHLYNEAEVEEVRGMILASGVRNALHIAVAPTASSATSKGLTESIEPLMYLSYVLEGAVSTQVLAPDLARLRPWYQTAYTINPFRSVKLNAIRQLWIDQSQSFNMYITQDKWDYEYLAKLHLYAWKLGCKTMYYLWTPKSTTEDACASCSA